MRNVWALLAALTLWCAGLVPAALAAPVHQFYLKESVLLEDPDREVDHLGPIVWSLQWLAEQEAIRSRLLFPREVMETDVPLLDPRRSSAEQNGI